MSDQLDMFARRKAKRAPPAIERHVHIAVADAIRLSLTPGFMIFHVPNGELRTDSTGRLLKRMLVLPGVSDLIVLGPERFVGALELKRRGMKPTDEQLAFLEFVRAIGGCSDWVDSYEDAIGILLSWGALRDRIR